MQVFARYNGRYVGCEPGYDQVYADRLRISPGATRMLAGFKAVGATTVLVSGGFTFFTDRLKARLGLDVAVANTLGVDDGRLTGRIEGTLVDAKVKADTVRTLKQRLAGNDGLTVALGDGANDLPLFAESDIAIAYRAKPIVRAQASGSEVRGVTVLYDQATEGIMDPVTVVMSSAFAPFSGTMSYRTVVHGSHSTAARHPGASPAENRAAPARPREA